ncbi:phosphonate C-P lyase system protein PhnH [Terrarubrum flagellatum]|uniref:phosphonate C-P lyase system protein PhnH n=1 Tax=Terrirubrum flagellatum TaxID=2895980 RepID=UPI00314543F1
MTFDLAVRDLAPGFSDPVFDSQSIFRGVMNAIAYPGRIHQLTRLPDRPAALAPATAAVALTLCDFETPLWLDKTASTPAALAYVRFHCGAPVVEASNGARFAIVGDAQGMPRLSAFDIGEDQYPDRSATLIIQTPSLTDGPRRRWTGPGIRDAIDVSIAGLSDWFWDDWTMNRELYPLGVDVIFTSGDSIIGLPRGVSVEG